MFKSFPFVWIPFKVFDFELSNDETKKLASLDRNFRHILQDR